MGIDPRWGASGRDRKALAILHTMSAALGPDVVRGRWLDVGCGSGGIAATLAQHVARVDGIDAEPWDRWASFMQANPNLNLMSGICDGPAPPGPAAAYEVIICNQVYEHVSDPQRLLANIHRMLAPDGSCYFAGPNLLWPIEPHVYWPFVHWIKRTTALRLMEALGSKDTANLDAYSAHLWRLNAWFEASGFQVRNAIPDRLRSAQGSGIAARAARLIGTAPGVLHSALLPFAPSFVFILSKSRA